MRINPVLEREVRERPRTVGAVVMLTFFLAMLAAVCSAVYEIERYAAGNGEVMPTSVSRIGQGQFEWVLFLMLLLVLFLVPGYTASAIAGERERQTLVPMQLTLLRPARIVSGKAAASVAYLGLLVVASAPLLGLAFVIGGVSLVQVIKGLAAILFVGLVTALVTVTCSTLVRRTASATVLAYTVVLALLFGTVALWSGVTGLMRLRIAGPDNEFAPQQLVALNPVMFVSAAVDTTDPAKGLPRGSSQAVTPFAGARMLMHPEPRMNISSPTRSQPSTVAPPFDVFGGFVWWSLVIQTAFAGLCWLIASRRLRTPADRER
jgi:ABC-type transport system involved in multi-copper enzyme maturation permease subunit